MSIQDLHSPLVGPSSAWHSSGREGQECAKALARMNRQGEEGKKTNQQGQKCYGEG